MCVEIDFEYRSLLKKIKNHNSKFVFYCWGRPLCLGRNIHFRFVFISIFLSDAHPRAGRHSRQSYVSAALSPFHIYLFISSLQVIMFLVCKGPHPTAVQICMLDMWLSNSKFVFKCIYRTLICKSVAAGRKAESWGETTEGIWPWFSNKIFS